MNTKVDEQQDILYYRKGADWHIIDPPVSMADSDIGEEVIQRL